MNKVIVGRHWLLHVLLAGIVTTLAVLPDALADDMMPMGPAPASQPGQMNQSPSAAGMPMPGGSSSGGGMGMGCMECMGEMGSMGAMGSAAASGAMNTPSAVPPNALPGFPGTSHLYHVGADGFFLNHPQHVQLNAEQQLRLGRIREKALLERAAAQRKIEEAEQQMFVLTGMDQPDIRKIEAQARAIEELQVQRRLAYIRAVGEATTVLTDQQRRAVLGTTP